ncbi:ABC-type multidrug transport system fused ATPase/permease subunit [Lactobacillus colini]|uniref:ABC-type multidrug transport system fused ATPase/permease subunit n=1 Tax=Lactobacillus colini TaxID=1819254 RepID=A0ABS4MCX3_9LACO|nr:ABC-type multidrug transport system fused ATPase/permease subunit [Lactobacillus colini]
MHGSRSQVSVEKSNEKFSFVDFFKLINQTHPHYWQLIVGILLGLISTVANLLVPQLAQKIINSFKNLNPTIITITITVFIGGILISALSGLILGIFGESVVANLRKLLWNKLLHLPIKYSVP